MKLLTLTDKYLKTIAWLHNEIIDWASAGTIYKEDGSQRQMAKYHYAYSFDTAITSTDGQYAFVYKRLGTKGLLLKNGDIMREINRSYYHAENYEYPTAFFTSADGRTFLVHCPREYCRIDFEDVETGELITDTPDRKPSDFFHSRFEVSPDNKYMISKGWVWSPWDALVVFELEACVANPTLLDRGFSVPDNSSEICSASFINNDKILICLCVEDELFDEKVDSTLFKYLAVWNFKTNELSESVRINYEIGSLFAIDEFFCWDIFKYPKIINFRTGEVIDKNENIPTGLQQSAIIHHVNDTIPLIAYNKQTGCLAVANTGRIDILSHD